MDIYEATKAILGNAEWATSGELLPFTREAAKWVVRELDKASKLAGIRLTIPCTDPQWLKTASHMAAALVARSFPERVKSLCIGEDYEQIAEQEMAEMVERLEREARKTLTIAAGAV